MPIICKTCKDSFTNELEARKHFVLSHGTTKCRLCLREAAKNGRFCETCRKAFQTEISNQENQESFAERIRIQLAKLEKENDRHFFALKGAFLDRQAELFCSHNNPKDAKCEACEKFEAREVRSSKNIIHIEL